MSKELEKIKAYVGFSIKSREIVFGADNLEKAKKKLKLIMVSKKLSESSKRGLEQLSKSLGLKIITFSDKDFNFIADSDRIKVVAITSQSLADAILSQRNNMEEQN